MSFMHDAIIYLIAAIISVPISKRLGCGSVLGYLAAGIAIGPFGMSLVGDAQNILGFAELGVIFLLFVIGLELQPSRLWVLRRMMFGLGGSQILATAALLTLLAHGAGMPWPAATLTGLILAPSSTPFVLQLLAEKKQLTSAWGRGAFAILLMQDLSVVPLIALIPLFGSGATHGLDFDPARLAIMVATIAALIVGGRWLLRPVFRIVARSDIPEIFTATALLVVIGAALLMELAHMSAVLGAFIAGMLLADSEYRHQLEADLAPFKGLLLGLFFIAVGMSVNITLLLREPLFILAIVLALMTAKVLVLMPLARLYGIGANHGAARLGIVLAQGGEFAFVLFGLAQRENILVAEQVDRLTLAVAVSMLLTPLVCLAAEALLDRGAKAEPTWDSMRDDQNAVIVAGFGRVGQIAGRLLAIAGIPFTALEIDSTQVDVVRRYGGTVWYGDASKLDLLRAAGGANARLFVLAIDDMEASLRTAATVMRNFPQLTIVARARNRRHQHRLMNLGIRHIYRETLLSSLAIGEQVLLHLDFAAADVRRLIDTFKARDEKLIVEQHALQHDEARLIQSSRDTARELEMLLRDDLKRGG